MRCGIGEGEGTWVLTRSAAALAVLIGGGGLATMFGQCHASKLGGGGNGQAGFPAALALLLVEVAI